MKWVPIFRVNCVSNNVWQRDKLLKLKINAAPSVSDVCFYRFMAVSTWWGFLFTLFTYMCILYAHFLFALNISPSIIYGKSCNGSLNLFKLSVKSSRLLYFRIYFTSLLLSAKIENHYFCLFFNKDKRNRSRRTENRINKIS